MRNQDGPVHDRTNRMASASELPQDVAAVAAAIERDFQHLVENLSRAIELVRDTRDELSLRLSRTRSVAERGVELSLLLLDLAREKNET